MNETPVHIVTEFAHLPKKPKVTLWDWIKYYAFNIYRKPLVIKRQKELKEIFVFVKKQLEETILPTLWDRRISCLQCREAYALLKSQEFLSQLDMVLKSLSRDKEHTHWPMFDSFRNAQNSAFEKSEELSAWINGFR